MKKILFIFALATAMIVPSISHGQTLVRLKQGLTADTLKASTTYTTTAVNLNFGNLQAVYATVAIDSVSGNPAGTMTMQQSVDGTHWTTAGTPWTFTNSGTGTHLSLISLNPFLGAFVRFSTVTTGTAQKSRYWITVRSANAN